MVRDFLGLARSRVTTSPWSLSLLALLAGCSAAGGGTGEGAGGAGSGAGPGTGGGLGTGGTLNLGGSTGTGGSGAGSGCAAELQLVYVIDDANILYTFDPREASIMAFTRVGTIGCSGQPNSMAVGRDGFAYVLEGGGLVGWNCQGVYRVSVTDASCQGQVPFSCGAQGFSKFGMGFSTDAAGIEAERLFLANTDGASQLGILDTTTGAATTVGALPGAAEFTGNGNGELWGFFPELSPPAVLQIDKATGGTLRSLPLTALPPYGLSVAFAFAFWGGSFYVFYATDTDPLGATTSVWKVDPSGAVTRHIAPIGRRIVGAGVSTCAPVVPPT